MLDYPQSDWIHFVGHGCDFEDNKDEPSANLWFIILEKGKVVWRIAGRATTCHLG
jgi:hypothetical protein